MLRSILKSKIHRATVTQTELQYEGSLTLDRKLMDAADLLAHERMMVYNISNGERFDTYIIEGRENSGIVCINGAAARKACPGDLIIIAAYGLFHDSELERYSTKIVLVDEKNRITRIKKIPLKS